MKATTAVIIVTIYLTFYIGLFTAGLSLGLLTCLYLASPVLIIWMISTVLKDHRDYPSNYDPRSWPLE